MPLMSRRKPALSSPSARRRRKAKLELKARRIVEHLDACAVKAGDGGNQAEPQTMSRCVAALLEAIEPLENVLAFVDGNAGTVVGDRYHGLSVGAFDCNRHSSPGTAMLDRVVDK